MTRVDLYSMLYIEGQQKEKEKTNFPQIMEESTFHLA